MYLDTRFRSARRSPLSGRCLLLITGSVLSTLAANPGLAQEAESKRESAEITPYTGPPIYLPEGEAPPPPTRVESRTIKEPFPGTDTPRFERRVAKFSDNTVVSDGPNKEYHSNGQLYADGQFELGKAVGKWTYYHPSGQKAKEVSYADGRPDGEVTVYNTDGKVLAKRVYAAGKRAGVWESYDETGEQKVREDHYADGKANGLFKVWYSNGQLQREMPFVEGKQTGVATEWTRTGEKRAEVAFKDGKRDGKTTVWQRDGKVVEQVYEEGRLVPKG